MAPIWSQIGKNQSNLPDAAVRHLDTNSLDTGRAPGRNRSSPDTIENWMISLTRINKQYGRQILFVDASFQLNPGEKVGLVGPNGSGKTTVFRMMVGEETPDDGEVSVPRKLSIGY